MVNVGNNGNVSNFHIHFSKRAAKVHYYSHGMKKWDVNIMLCRFVCSQTNNLEVR